MLLAAEQATSLEELGNIAKEAGIVDYSKYKSPYFKVQRTDIDFVQKSAYIKDDAESKRASLLQVLDQLCTVSCVEDETDCMQGFELRDILGPAKLLKTGTVTVLRNRTLRHLLAKKLDKKNSQDTMEAEEPKHSASTKGASQEKTKQKHLHR